MNGERRSPPRGSYVVRNFWAIVALCLVVGVAVVLFGAPPFDGTRGGARYFQCRNHLKQIELALLDYHDSYGTFPPAVTYGPDGKPWHSWRVLILPFLEQKDLYEQYRFDERWDSPHNRGVTDSIRYDAPYFCYADDTAQKNRTTSYVAVVGDGTMWPRNGSAVRIGDAVDGKSVTIHVVEMSDSGILWTEPRDLDFDRMAFAVLAEEVPGIRSRHTGEERWFGRWGPKRANVSFVDGKSRTLEDGTPPETVRSLLIRNDGGPAEFGP